MLEYFLNIFKIFTDLRLKFGLLPGALLILNKVPTIGYKMVWES